MSMQPKQKKKEIPESFLTPVQCVPGIRQPQVKSFFL